MRPSPQQPSDDALSASAKGSWLDAVPLAVALFAFWTVLSGKLDAFHLGLGAVSALAVAAAAQRIFDLDPPVGPSGRHPFASLPWLRLAAYMPWLIVQIVTASFQVAAIVLRPRIRIRPTMFRFRCSLPNNVARATLANSITLTPGTVTIDVMGDEYLVHALTEDSSAPLESDEPGNMKERVASVFRA